MPALSTWLYTNSVDNWIGIDTPSPRLEQAARGAVASVCALCETRASPRRHTMKKTGSETPSPEDSSGGNEVSAEIIERARLQADVAQQRVRLAKEELHRARKRLKEAKREARRSRKYAFAARKDWKRARRKAKKNGSTEGQKQRTALTSRRRKSRVKSAAARTKRSPSRHAAKRGGRARARAHK
jgi:hypothetical protein